MDSVAMAKPTKSLNRSLNSLFDPLSTLHFSAVTQKKGLLDGEMCLLLAIVIENC